MSDIWPICLFLSLKTFWLTLNEKVAKKFHRIEKRLRKKVEDLRLQQHHQQQRQKQQRQHQSKALYTLDILAYNIAIKS